MAIKRYTIDPKQKVSIEQLEMLEEAAKRAPVFDEDNPELTEAELSKFKRAGAPAE